jgi:hypothetical protein
MFDMDNLRYTGEPGRDPSIDERAYVMQDDCARPPFSQDAGEFRNEARLETGPRVERR